jgi:hypothetical protein
MPREGDLRIGSAGSKTARIDSWRRTSGCLQPTATRFPVAVTNEAASTISLMTVRRSPPHGRCPANRRGFLEKDDAVHFNDRELRLVFCHRCGALVRPRGEHVHTNWHRGFEDGAV